MTSVPVQVALSGFATAAVELALVLVIARLVYAIVARALVRTAAMRGGALAESSRRLKGRAANVLIVSSALLAIVLLASNVWLGIHGISAWTYTVSFLKGIAADSWVRAAVALAKLASVVVACLAFIMFARRGLRALERAVSGWEPLRNQDRDLEIAFRSLDRLVVHAGCFLLVLLAFVLLEAPASVVAALLTFMRAWLIVMIGLLLIRSSDAIVGVVDQSARRYLEVRDWHGYYDHLHALLPTFRACIEYALWIATASLALVQLGWIESLSAFSPRLIEAIGLFFLGRVAIELGHLEIARRMLPPEGLDDMARRRRETMAPIVRSAFTYAVYFTTAVLILALIGFNPMPFLAGAGILGLVVGFGAQSLIHDVVSGFFILFENTYLVGDAIEAAGAKGVVEGIEFRTTKIRDADGRLHIVRNGDVKEVVNYSKEYAMAVVAVDVPYDTDLAHVFAILRDAGERTRRENPDVLGEIEIDGISAFGATTMTVRTSTRVRPGRHDKAAAALRLAIKEAFDDRSVGLPRTALVPQKLADPSAHMGIGIDP